MSQTKSWMLWLQSVQFRSPGIVHAGSLVLMGHCGRAIINVMKKSYTVRFSYESFSSDNGAGSNLLLMTIKYIVNHVYMNGQLNVHTKT